MAKYLDKAGLKHALTGFWTGVKAYADEISRVASEGYNELLAAIGLINTRVGANADLATTEKTTIVGAINEVKGAVDTLTTDSAVTVKAAASATEGYLKTYEVFQGGEDDAHKVGTIDIPKDLVVTEGSCVKGTWSGETFTESASGKDHALKLVIANQEAPVYINTKNLVDIYTAEQGAAQVQLTISDKNVVSAVIVAKSITNTELSDAVNASLALADSALQSADLTPYRTAADQDAIDLTKVDKVEGKSLILDTEIARLAAMSDGANKVEGSEQEMSIKIDGVETAIIEKANTVHDAAYVHTDNNYTTEEKTKLAGIDANATKDEALTNEEIDEVIAEIFPAE